LLAFKPEPVSQPITAGIVKWAAKGAGAPARCLPDDENPGTAGCLHNGARSLRQALAVSASAYFLYQHITIYSLYRFHSAFFRIMAVALFCSAKSDLPNNQGRP
jgi:hypothetical protein